MRGGTPIVGGQRGPAGPAGVNAYSTISPGYTQPNVGADVNVRMTNDGAWATVGQVVYVAGGGYYEVRTPTASPLVTLRNLGYSGNASPGAAISSGVQVSPAGPIGATGISGYAALAAFTQPAAIGGTASSVSYTGPSPGVGAFLDLVVSAAVAGRYLVTVDSGSALTLQLLTVGTVALGGAVGASMALHAGPADVAYNTSAYLVGTVSTSSGSESTLHSVTFTAPASGAIRLSGNVNATLSAGSGALQCWLDIASGPANSRQSFTVHVHVGTTRNGASLDFRVTGLTPGSLYTARWRWIGPGGSTRSCTPSDNEQAYILVENYAP